MGVGGEIQMALGGELVLPLAILYILYIVSSYHSKESNGNNSKCLCGKGIWEGGLISTDSNKGNCNLMVAWFLTKNMYCTLCPFPPLVHFKPHANQ